MSKQIKRAEKRGAKRWRDKYRPVYLAMLDKKDARIKTLETFVAQLVEASGAPCPELLYDTVCKLRKRAQETGAGADGCALPCFRLQQEQAAVSSLEHDVRRLTAERDQLTERVSELEAAHETLLGGSWDRLEKAMSVLQGAQEAAEYLRSCDGCEAVRRLKAGPSERLAELQKDVGVLMAERDQLQAENAALRLQRDEGIALGDRLSNSLADVMAEREEFRRLLIESVERLEARCAGEHQSREERDTLQAANVKALAEVVRVRLERDDVSKRYMEAENDLNRAFDAAGLTSGTVDRLVEWVKELRRENAAQMEQLIAYSYASEFSQQHIADAKLGRLIRALPVGYHLARDIARPDTHPWACNCGDGRIFFHETPEQVLTAAGITENEYPNAEPPALHPDTARVADLEAERDAARADQLKARTEAAEDRVYANALRAELNDAKREIGRRTDTARLDYLESLRRGREQVHVGIDGMSYLLCCSQTSGGAETVREAIDRARQSATGEGVEAGA